MNEKALFNTLYTALKNRQGLYYTPAKITKLFRELVNNDDIVFKTSRNPLIELGDVVVTGEYDCLDDMENYSSITIYVGFNPKETLLHVGAPGAFNLKKLAINVVECLGHEQVKQTRHRSRNFDVNPVIFISGAQQDDDWQEQQFIGQEDEVEAFGYSIACEMFLKYRANVLTSQHLFKTLMYRVYSTQFGENHPIVNQLVSYTLSYYSKLRGENNGKSIKQKVQSIA